MNLNKNFTNDPFFIVYDSRSGSTFLANLLVKSANVVIAPEVNFITYICLNYQKEYISDDNELVEVIKIVTSDLKFSDWNIEIAEIKTLVEKELPISVRDFILTICTIYKNKNSPNSIMFGLKHGPYLTYYQNIKKLFPNSKYIGIVRDGRAVFNSKKSSIFSVTGKPFETDPRKAAIEWCRMFDLLVKFSEKYSETTAIIYYEEVINKLDETIIKLCNFLDVPTNSTKEASDIYIVPERYGSIHKNVKKEPIASRISAWKQSLTASEIYIFEAVAYEQLLLAGYELINKQFLLKHFLRKNKRFWKSLKLFKNLFKI